MSQSNVRPPLEELWDKYSYNPFTGILHRRDNDRPLRGNRCSKSSHQLSIHGTARHPYGVVVFAWINGRWPIQGMQIDHIDRNPFNNRCNNLREVTRRQNMQNTKRAKGGAYLNSNTWFATIRIQGKSKYLGSFKTETEARSAYLNECTKHQVAFIPELITAVESIQTSRTLHS
jgi:hypothetical protein